MVLLYRFSPKTKGAGLGHAYKISIPTTPILSRRAINHDLLSEA